MDSARIYEERADIEDDTAGDDQVGESQVAAECSNGGAEPEEAGIPAAAVETLLVVYADEIPAGRTENGA